MSDAKEKHEYYVGKLVARLERLRADAREEVMQSHGLDVSMPIPTDQCEEIEAEIEKLTDQKWAAQKAAEGVSEDPD